jgi:hypothetical protein
MQNFRGARMISPWSMETARPHSVGLTDVRFIQTPPFHKKLARKMRVMRPLR